MKISLFNNEILIKSLGCSNGSISPQLIPPSVNIFVKTTNGCNACCLFCSNEKHINEKLVFNHSKFWQIVDELKSKEILINRVNITGGEPSIVTELVEQILEKACEVEYSDLHLHLNTNGLLASSQKLMRHTRWNSISISLHHYNIDYLSKLYRVNIKEEAFNFTGIDINKVNGSCNLIRGYIDSPKEVEMMLMYAVKLGLPRLGFVSLMKINEFCKKHYVDFSEIDFESISHLYFTESKNRGLDCKCSNYLYNHDGKILEVYMRNYSNPNYCESSLLYDGEFLRQGFHDDNIIY